MSKKPSCNLCGASLVEEDCALICGDCARPRDEWLKDQAEQLAIAHQMGYAEGDAALRAENEFLAATLRSETAIKVSITPIGQYARGNVRRQTRQPVRSTLEQWAVNCGLSSATAQRITKGRVLVDAVPTNSLPFPCLGLTGSRNGQRR